MPNRIFNAHNIAKKRILVIGDVMIDHYVNGSCTRISPEAPVPVVKVSNERFVLGGAANVAANIRATGAHTTCIGIVGNDEDRQRFQALLLEAKIHSLLHTCHGFRTMRKTRIVAHGQQIVRCDYEVSTKMHSVEKSMIKDLEMLAAESDAIVVSDYDKGVCTPGIIKKIAGFKNIPWVVDPKKPWTVKYPGASLLTPNAKEASRVGSTVSDPKQAGKASLALLKRTRAGGVAVTIGGYGACMSTKSSTVHFPVAPVEVFDPTGAGDVFVAFAALAFAIGSSAFDAVRFANAAAAVSVGRHGATVVSWDEALESLFMQPQPVILSQHG